MFQKIKKISKLRGYGLFTNYHKSLHNFITKKKVCNTIRALYWCHILQCAITKRNTNFV